MRHGQKEVTMGIYLVCKIGNLNAHQKNPLPGFQVDWNQQVNILVVVSLVHKIRGNGGATAMQRWAEHQCIPLAPCEAQKASKTYPFFHKERQSADVYRTDSPEGGPSHTASK